MRALGFTGTQLGMTLNQRLALRMVLADIDFSVFFHGSCVGSDFEAHVMVSAEYPDVTIIALPGDQPDKTAALLPMPTFECPPAPMLERNETIAHWSDCLVATPRGFAEVRRSGTWATIRYFRKRNKPVCIIYPDGTMNSREPVS